MRWPMLAGGKDDGRAIVACARISSICAVVRSSTICMSCLVLSRTLLSFKVRLDYSTGSLEEEPRGQRTDEFNFDYKWINVLQRLHAYDTESVTPLHPPLL